MRDGEPELRHLLRRRSDLGPRCPVPLPGLLTEGISMSAEKGATRCATPFGVDPTITVCTPENVGGSGVHPNRPERGLMNNFRNGDRARSVVGDVVATGADWVRIETAEGNSFVVTPGQAELVERPGPRLGDLPDGTVIRRRSDDADDLPYIKLGDGLTAVVDIHSEHGIRIADWKSAFDVIGACPGTPAWDLWRAADIRLGGGDLGEWWRSE